MNTGFIRLAACLLLAAGIAALAATPAAVAEEMTLVTKETLKNMLGDPTVAVLDVRSGKDWKSSEFKIEGAQRVDPDDVAAWAGNYPKDRAIVLYCA